MLNTAPRAGNEQTDKRPYIVLSHDIIIDYSVIVASISSTKRNYPLYVAIDPSYGMKTSISDTKGVLVISNRSSQAFFLYSEKHFSNERNSL